MCLKWVCAHENAMTERKKKEKKNLAKKEVQNENFVNWKWVMSTLRSRRVLLVWFCLRWPCCVLHHCNWVPTITINLLLSLVMSLVTLQAHILLTWKKKRILVSSAALLLSFNIFPFRFILTPELAHFLRFDCAHYSLIMKSFLPSKENLISRTMVLDSGVIIVFVGDQIFFFSSP